MADPRGTSRTLEVHVVTPEREVWTGEASMVVARAVDGDVGILPGHSPMVAILRVGPLFIETVDEGRLSAAVDGGFVHVTGGLGDEGTRIDVLGEQVVLSSEVDPDEVAEHQRQADELAGREAYGEARDERAKVATRERIRGE